MKRKSIQITALAFAVSISLGSTGFAATFKNTCATGQMNHCHNGDHCKKHSFYESEEILIKLGLTEQDIISGREANKTIFDLTKAKNLSENQVRAIIIEQITTSINNKVIVGKMSKDEGTKDLEEKKLRIQNWDGSLKEEKRDFHIPQKLGITEQDIILAERDNKTLFDLAKVKGFTPEQVKAMMMEEGTILINKAVEAGQLTKEKANLILTEMKSKVDGWDGSFK
ncbi:MAG: hypothetical protein H7Y18_01330 [Clostridiaceae bacterium]|nr:hypothetical protein [Clostridiaceae bacterium]